MKIVDAAQRIVQSAQLQGHAIEAPVGAPQANLLVESDSGRIAPSRKKEESTSVMQGTLATEAVPIPRLSGEQRDRPSEGSATSNPMVASSQDADDDATVATVQEMAPGLETQPASEVNSVPVAAQPEVHSMAQHAENSTRQAELYSVDPVAQSTSASDATLISESGQLEVQSTVQDAESTHPTSEVNPMDQLVESPVVSDDSSVSDVAHPEMQRTVQDAGNGGPVADAQPMGQDAESPPASDASMVPEVAQPVAQLMVQHAAEPVPSMLVPQGDSAQHLAGEGATQPTPAASVQVYQTLPIGPVEDLLTAPEALRQEARRVHCAEEVDYAAPVVPMNRTHFEVFAPLREEDSIHRFQRRTAFIFSPLSASPVVPCGPRIRVSKGGKLRVWKRKLSSRFVTVSSIWREKSRKEIYPVKTRPSILSSPIRQYNSPQGGIYLLKSRARLARHNQRLLKAVLARRRNPVANVPHAVLPVKWQPPSWMVPQQRFVAPHMQRARLPPSTAEPSVAPPVSGTRQAFVAPVSTQVQLAITAYQRRVSEALAARVGPPGTVQQPFPVPIPRLAVAQPAVVMQTPIRPISIPAYANGNSARMGAPESVQQYFPVPIPQLAVARQAVVPQLSIRRISIPAYANGNHGPVQSEEEAMNDEEAMTNSQARADQPISMDALQAQAIAAQRATLAIINQANQQGIHRSPESRGDGTVSPPATITRVEAQPLQNGALGYANQPLAKPPPISNSTLPFGDRSPPLVPVEAFNAGDSPPMPPALVQAEPTVVGTQAEIDRMDTAEMTAEMRRRVAADERRERVSRATNAALIRAALASSTVHRRSRR